MKTKIPKFKFKSLEEERRFWDNHSVTEFLDELKPARLEFVKPKKKLISIRLDTVQLESIREIASRSGLGYLSLIRHWLAERLSKEYKHLPVHERLK